MRLRSIGALVLVALVCAACAHVTNTELAKFDPSAETSYRYSPNPARDTLVIVTFSGGGMRAAALSYGVLHALASLPGTDGGSLLDQVDIISSVSGGSVTAGWYALHGQAGLEPEDDSNPLWHFLYTDWTSDIAWRALNPGSLVRYAVSNYQRSDVLAGFFADRLFGNATYAQVLAQYNQTKAEGRQPYTILNATDFGHETGFAFTQGQFDLICSDLGQYRLADAVAASANFPLAFSATGIRNYSSCDAQRSQAWQEYGPPQWISEYDQFDNPQHALPDAIRLGQVRLARQAKRLLTPEPTDRFLHLLDGGLVDNLGIRSTFDIQDHPARVPGLYVRLGPKRPDGYQNIRRVLYIVVNARKLDPATIDHREYPPGAIGSILPMINTQVDNSILHDELYVIAELEAIRYVPRSAPFLSKKKEFQLVHQVSQDAASPSIYFVAVDFEMIPDPKCREYYWSLDTSWGLKPEQITNLRTLAQVLLRKSPDLKKFYEASKEDPPKEIDFSTACEIAQ